MPPLNAAPPRIENSKRPAGLTAFLKGRQIILPLLAKGDGWLAVDKPAGLTVHNLPGQDLCSMVGDALKKDPIGREIGYDPSVGIHPVHRLDRETSGVMLLACHQMVIREISTRMQDDSTRKSYAAILHGRLPVPPDSEEWIDWGWPLTKSAGGRRHPAGKGKQLPSRTRVRVIRHTERYTLVTCELETGRKHQIRRHAKLAGHAVVGDDRYGTRRSVEFLKQKGFDRLALHARSLTIRLPGAASPLEIRSPTLPQAMQTLLNE